MDGDENHATTKKTSTDGVVTWKVKVNLSDDAKTMTVTDNLQKWCSPNWFGFWSSLQSNACNDFW